MSAPSVELQSAIYHALSADAALMSLVDGVYDRVPKDAFGVRNGYISFGPEYSVYQDFACLEIEEINIQLDVWSRVVGRVHCKEIVSAAQRVLQALPDLTQNALILSEAPLTRITADPDGLTTHGIIQLRYEVEPG